MVGPIATLIPLRFEEKFRQHLNLNDGSDLAALLQNPQVLEVHAGLLQAFLAPPPGHVAEVLEQQRERGRRRKQAIPRAVDSLIKAAGCYRDLQGLEQLNFALAEQMEREAFRLLLQLNRWKTVHNEKRLGFKNWIFLIILQDFVTLWTERQGRPYRLTVADLLRLQTAGEYALGLHSDPTIARLPVADDLRGLEHFRTHPENQQLCSLAAICAAHLASHLHLRPFLIFRNEI